MRVLRPKEVVTSKDVDATETGRGWRPSTPDATQDHRRKNKVNRIFVYHRLYKEQNSELQPTSTVDVFLL